MNPTRTRHGARIAYGCGAVAYGVTENGFNHLLLLYYNQVIGLPAARVGVALMLALLVDTLVDPLIGRVSDRWRSRWGRRHPFMYAAAVPAAASFLLLWHPPADWTHDGLFFYLLATAILARAFIALYEVPSAALVAEFSRDYDERTALVGYRHLFGWWGGLTMGLLTFFVFLRPTPEHPIGQLNPQGYADYALAAAALMLVFMLVSAAGTHHLVPSLLRPPPAPRRSIRRRVLEVAHTLSHRSLLMLLGAGLATAMLSGITFSLNLYFNTYFWELTAAQIGLLTLGAFPTVVLAAVIASYAGRRLGKRLAAMVLITTSAAAGALPLLLRLLDAFPPNNSPAMLPCLFAFNATGIATTVAAAIVAGSMMADVVEDSEIVTGQRNEGLFFAAAGLMQKSVSGVGIFLSGAILTLVALPGKAVPGTVPQDALNGLATAFVVALVALKIVALLFIRGYRIDRVAHEKNLSQLRQTRDHAR